MKQTHTVHSTLPHAPSYRLNLKKNLFCCSLLAAGLLTQGVGLAASLSRLQDGLDPEFSLFTGMNVGLPNLTQDGSPGQNASAGGAGGAGGINGSGYNGGAGGNGGPGVTTGMAGGGSNGSSGSGGDINQGGTGGIGGGTGGYSVDILGPTVIGFGGGGGGGGVDSVTGQGGGGGGGGGSNNYNGHGLIVQSGGGGGGGAIGVACSTSTCATPGIGGNGGAGGNGDVTSADVAGGGGGGGSGTLVLTSSPVTFTASSQGGSGGVGGQGGLGGTSGSGGGGGAGGYAIFVANNTTVTLSGVNALGGGGGDGGLGVSSGTPGIGGPGVYFANGGNLINQNGTITGGTGGMGDYLFNGLVGANGGSGVVMASSGTITNNGTIQGGTGGIGFNVDNFGAAITNGGNGVSMPNGGAITNTGTIQGGTGGVYPLGTPGDGTAGLGGDGINGANLAVVDSGTLAGGLSGDATSMSDAVHFTSGMNSLELQAGYHVVGLAVGVAGGSDQLILGGSVDSTFDPSLIGTQYINFVQVQKTGASVWTIAGNASSTTTPWAVNQGTLNVNGSLGGNMTVANGATLTGTGTVGGTVTVDGTLAPGNNNVGILTLGNYIANPDSTYQVMINPAGQTTNSVHVLGTATLLGGTVNLLKAPGVYPAIRYTLLTADGGVTGSYSNLVQNLPFLTLALSYDPDHVYLNVSRNSTSFPAIAGTPNQINTAIAAQSLGMGNVIYNAIVSVSNAQEAQQAFDSLSGEVHASLISALVMQSSYARNITLDRLYDTFTDPTPPCYCDTGLSIWTTGIGSWGELEGNGNAHDIDSETGGLFVGADQALINDHLRLGLLAGYTRSNFDVSQLDSHASSDDYSLGIYGGAKFYPIRLNAGGIYTWHDIDTHRNVIFPNFYNHLTSSYRAHTEQAFIEGGYPLTWRRFNLEPIINLAYVDVDTNAFTEHGGPAALHGNSGSQNVFYSTLGARQAATFYQTEKFAFGEKVQLGWQHTYKSIVPHDTFNFTSGGSPFFINGAPIARDAAVIDAGINADTKHHTLQFRLAYMGQWANTTHDNGVTGTVTWQIG